MIVNDQETYTVSNPQRSYSALRGCSPRMTYLLLRRMGDAGAARGRARFPNYSASALAFRLKLGQHARLPNERLWQSA
jgi:hypothetical protein